MIQVSILIVNYNTAQWVQGCIESIKQYTRDITVEIIVVDNHSIQRDITSVLVQFPEVVFIQSDFNLGFGTACNLAALNAKGDFLFLLNPDTLLKNNAVKHFFDFWQAHHQFLSIACLGTIMQNEYGLQQHSYGSFPKIKSLVFLKLKSNIRKILNQSQRSPKIPIVHNFLKVDYVTGADLFISKENFQRFQGFDEGFFMYFEETDLQKRMKDSGLCAYIIEGPNIIHKQGASTEANPAQLRVLYFTSLLFYVKKHSSRIQYLLFSACWHLLDIKTFTQKILLTFKMHQQ